MAPTITAVNSLAGIDTLVSDSPFSVSGSFTSVSSVFVFSEQLTLSVVGYSANASSITGNIPSFYVESSGTLAQLVVIDSGLSVSYALRLFKHDSDEAVHGFGAGVKVLVQGATAPSLYSEAYGSLGSIISPNDPTVGQHQVSFLERVPRPYEEGYSWLGTMWDTYSETNLVLIASPVRQMLQQQQLWDIPISPPVY